MARKIQISEDVLNVLAGAECLGNSLKLTGQLDRGLYVKTNEALEAAGGKWNKKFKAHLFEDDAAERVEELILTGQYERATDVRAEFGFFETPDPLARQIVENAHIQEGHTVLEPSAGRGAIVRHIPFEFGNTMVELDQGRAGFLKMEYPAWHVDCSDFLKWEPTANIPKKFDRIIMNPPFAKRADILHIRRAFDFLAPKGELVAIASASVMFRTDTLAKDFRDFVRSHFGMIVSLPEGTFKESGTMVNAVVITMEADS